jgi:hypothetical protein
MNVYSSAYYNRLVDVLENEFTCTKKALNDYFQEVALEYFKSHPSQHNSIDFIGTDFPNFLRTTPFETDFGIDQRIIADLAHFEYLIGLSSVAIDSDIANPNFKAFSESDWSTKKIALRPDVIIAEFSSSIAPAFEALRADKTPEVPDNVSTYYLFYRKQLQVHYAQINHDEFTFIERFQSPVTFLDVIGNESEARNLMNLLLQYQHFFVAQ